MGLFNKNREAAGQGQGQVATGRVQVMGTGCKKCHALYEAAVEALGESEVEYVTDMARVAEAGIMTLPALVVDGKVVSAGKVLAPSEVSTLVEEALK